LACNQIKSLPQLDINEHLYENINLHLSKPDGQRYTMYKEIQDIETVQKVMGILQSISWENVKGLISREPDYKISTFNIDRNISYEPVTYALWIPPINNNVELIIEGQSKYGKLSERESALLLSIFETP